VIRPSFSNAGDVCLAAGAIAPSIAVVIPCWNAEAWIARAIQSVLDQSIPGLDLIVIDDGSTDRSLEIVKSFGQAVRWESGPNLGACAARNRGLALTSSTWVAFLDADDYYEDDFFRAMVAQADDRWLDLMLGISKEVLPDGASVIHRYPIGLGTEKLLLGWLKGKYIQTGAVLWRTAFLRTLGGWNERVLKSQDIELVLRALLCHAKAESVAARYCVWFQHDGPDRIRFRVGHAHIKSEIEFHDELIALFPPQCPDLLQAMARRYYSLAAQAFRHGHTDLGRLALARSREFRFSGHLGSPIRRILMRACGLENYSRIRRKIVRRFPHLERTNGR
jgi:hypothetical protein